MILHLLYPLVALLGISITVSLQMDVRTAPLLGSLSAFLVLWFMDRAYGRIPSWSTRVWQMYVLITSSALSLLFSEFMYGCWNSEILRVISLHSMLLGSTFLAFYYGDAQTSPVEGGTPIDSTLFHRGLIVTAHLLALRLLSSFLMELISEEAYYWKYSESLALSYLDHPPLVAWCIRAGEWLFGTTEFGIRFLGILCWLGVVYFTGRITRAVFPHSSLLHVVVIATLLPFPLSIGFFMTPDTPLAMAWSATLYFLYQVFFQDKKFSWLGVGISLGFALLAKYPAVLLGISIPLFMAADERSRKWFLSPLPYLAAAVSLCIFSPVIVWNYQNNWASFAFQSTRRFSAEKEFSTHIWCAFLLLSLTPVGVKVFYENIKERVRSEVNSPPNSEDGISRRFLLFTGIFTLVPILAFGYASFSQEIKVNWIGPATLICIPLFAHTLSSPILRQRYLRSWVRLGLSISFILHSVIFLLVIGMPGISPPKAFRKFGGWEELAKIVEVRRAEIELRTQLPTSIAGGDSHYVASEIGFYGKKIALESQQAVPRRTEGRVLFHKSSLMFTYWTKPELLRGSTIIIVSRTENDLKDSELAKYFSRLDPIERIDIKREGKPFATFYMRVGFNYTSPVRDG
jgi:dolichol-phosphate mannosyltransferase